MVFPNSTGGLLAEAEFQSGPYLLYPGTLLCSSLPGKPKECRESWEVMETMEQGRRSDRMKSTLHQKCDIALLTGLSLWDNSLSISNACFWFIYFQFFGCAGSSLLFAQVFSKLRWAGAILPFDVWSSRCSGFSCCRAQVLGECAGWLWHTDSVTPQHVGSSGTRDWTHVPCTGRWIQVCAYRGTLIIEHHVMCTYPWVCRSPCMQMAVQWNGGMYGLYGSLSNCEVIYAYISLYKMWVPF